MYKGKFNFNTYIYSSIMVDIPEIQIYIFNAPFLLC